MQARLRRGVASDPVRPDARPRVPGADLLCRLM